MASTPTLASVLTAIKTALDAAGGLGTVVTYDHKYDVDAEYLRTLQNQSTGTLDLWIVDVNDTTQREPVGGEVFDVFDLRCRLYCKRANAATWGQTARALAVSAQDTLTANANVFAIGGQRQLLTEETVHFARFGKESVSDHRGSQVVFLAELRLNVESRRWDTEDPVAEETCTPESASCIIAGRVFSGSWGVFGD